MILDLAEIACMEPAALHGFRCRVVILVISQHDVAAAGKNFSVLVDHDLGIKKRRTDRTVTVIHDPVDSKDR